MSRRAWLAFASISLIWGVPYLFIKIAVRGGVPPATLAWGRVTLGALLLLAPFVLASPPHRVPTAGAIAAVVVLGVILLGEQPGAGAVAGLLLILAGWRSTGGGLPPLWPRWRSSRPVVRESGA